MRVAALAVGAFAVNSLPGLAPLVAPVADVLGIARRIDRSPGVALTFDDGPHPDGTPGVLELLRRAGATATFFLAGEQVELRPALAAEIVAAGHGVGLHCHRHRNMLRLTPAQIADDLRRGAATIEDATGHSPRLHRPPYGIYTALGLAAVRTRWRPLLWSRWGRDWRARISPHAIARMVTRDIGPGDVLLLHDADWYSAPGSWTRTLAALPEVLGAIEARGLKTVPAA
ncbi:MAG TPA: polysaccharide deacetylase family protein [Thermoleophilaceae bacterium]